MSKSRSPTIRGGGADKNLDWLEDPRERVRAFAAKYIAELEAMRDSERRRADESIALRKFEYGEE